MDNENYINDYLDDFVSLIKTHLSHWINDFKDFENNKGYNILPDLAVRDNYMDCYKQLELGIYKYILDNAIYNYITAIEECLMNSIACLPQGSDIKKFIENYIDKLIIFSSIQDLLDEYIDIITRKLESIRKIQICWRRSISDPRYKLCRNRLQREFQEMQE
jgi:hypothetical protein